MNCSFSSATEQMLFLISLLLLLLAASSALKSKALAVPGSPLDWPVLKKRFMFIHTILSVSKYFGGMCVAEWLHKGFAPCSPQVNSHQLHFECCTLVLVSTQSGLFWKLTWFYDAVSVSDFLSALCWFGWIDALQTRSLAYLLWKGLRNCDAEKEQNLLFSRLHYLVKSKKGHPEV